MNENDAPLPEEEATTDDASTGESNSAESSTDEPSGELTLEEQLEQLTAERDQQYDQLMRTRAELENVRRRNRNEIDELRKYQSMALARDLLPGLDNLQRAIAAGESSGNITDLLQGLQMVSQQFQSVLGQHGVEPIEAVGKPFDPNVHDAIQNMPSAEIPAMHVIAEAESGYKLHDRVVRPSKVLVSSGPPEEAS